MSPDLIPYPCYMPPLDAPPTTAFWPCGCGALLLERSWHNRSAAMPAHWAIHEPPITAALGLPHACQGVILKQEGPL
jgi:hypothetical protein